jgi:tyrosyl-DNA phosphodiesterase-1
MAREVIMVDDSDTDDDVAEIAKIPKPSVQPSRKPIEKPRPIQPIAATPSPATLDKPPPSTETAQPTSADSLSAKSPFLVDRAAMERERLARQKRLRGDVNTPNSSSSDEESDEDEPDHNVESGKRGAKRRKLDEKVERSTAQASSSANNHAEGKHVQYTPSRSLSNSNQELFLKGEVRPTWNEYARDDRKRFKIQDVIGDVSRTGYFREISFRNSS